MQQGQTLFVLQNELVDKKMETAMSARLAIFGNEMRDEFRADLEKIVTPLEKTVTAFKEDFDHFKVEMREFKQEIRTEMREFRQEMQDMRHEFGSRLTTVESILHGFGSRLTTVESVLGVMQQRQSEIRTRILDYSFKAGWTVFFAFVGGFSFLLSNYLHTLR